MKAFLFGFVAGAATMTVVAKFYLAKMKAEVLHLEDAFKAELKKLRNTF